MAAPTTDRPVLPIHEPARSLAWIRRLRPILAAHQPPDDRPTIRRHETAMRSLDHARKAAR